MSFGSTPELSVLGNILLFIRIKSNHSFFWSYKKDLLQLLLHNPGKRKKKSTMNLTVCLCPLPSPLANKNWYSLQAAFIFLYLSLAAWAVLWNELSQMFALGLTCHSFIVPIIIHPLRHVAAACRIMGLKETESQPHRSRIVCAKTKTVLPLTQLSLTSGKLQLKQDIHEHLEQAAP